MLLERHVVMGLMHVLPGFRADAHRNRLDAICGVGVASDSRHGLDMGDGHAPRGDDLQAGRCWPCGGALAARDQPNQRQGDHVADGEGDQREDADARGHPQRAP